MDPVEGEKRPPVPGEYGLPLPREFLYRELGIKGRKLRRTLATTADFSLTNKQLKRTKFALPPGARTTFHIAFSADGKLVASCHGDHNVIVSEVSTGKVVRTLAGHPRTPWVVCFHPTQCDLLASGCLAGHVRVWSVQGGSELLVTDSATVIASLSFHPTVKLLAIGTFNEVIFWDWSKPLPLARVSTENTKEKVRLVRFDRLGTSLITGITNYPGSSHARRSSPPRETSPPREPMQPNILRSFRPRVVLNRIEDPGGPTLTEQQDRFQESYRQLVTHYEDLVDHYHSFLRTRVDQGEETTPLPGDSSSDESLDEMEPRPGPSRLMRAEAPTSAHEAANAAAAGNRSSGLGSIEALAQNILEMQNLCSLARREAAPLSTVETQHVVELQQIRQHLEVLQDQTRRLQSSIRATLTSLASGSLAVLRSQMESPPPSREEPQSPALSPSLSGSSAFFRLSGSQREDVPGVSRMRVPPMVTMRYEQFESVRGEPQPGPSRANYFAHEEHARNCPFSQIVRPPPRMLTLNELGEAALLTPWPPFEQSLTGRGWDPQIVLPESPPPPPLALTQNQTYRHFTNNEPLNSDLGVRLFLSSRSPTSESWLSTFHSSLPLLPPSAHNAGTPRRRRHTWLTPPVDERLPSRIGSFSRVYFFRAADEMIPVYSGLAGQGEGPLGVSEVRENPQQSVFLFPVGLFLQGGPFEHNAQTLGLFWPPSSLQEDTSLLESRGVSRMRVYLRGSSSLVPERVRLDYDSTTLQASIRGFSISFNQPGLLVLDAVTNFNDLNLFRRPRELEGTVYVDYLAPFLDLLERFFGQRSRSVGQARPSQRIPTSVGSGLFGRSQILNLSGRRDRVRILGQVSGESLLNRINPRRIVTLARDAPGEEGPERRGDERRTQFSDPPERVLTLAVSAAASEILGQERPVESRIERVLNERGASAVTSSEVERRRIEDLQRRISVLSHWSRTRANQQTQTTRTNRRRPYEGENRTTDEQTVSDHWLLRHRRRHNPLPPTEIRSSTSGTSARTRAPEIEPSAVLPTPPAAHTHDDSTRFYPGYIPEILITPRARPPTYYTMDAATTAFLSSRIQKWDFRQFVVPDLTQMTGLVVRECSLHSDACLDISSDGTFLAVLQPSDSGAYSALGVYDLREETLGDLLYIYHFEQNTVSISISPSSDYLVVGYAGRGPLYRFVQQGRSIGQILSLTRVGGQALTLVPVREIYTESSSALMAINCMHFLPVPGLGIVYGTNIGTMELLS